jgi:hypothetical protein
MIGQFAITASEEVIAAGPDGLFHFKRVGDHASRPWSKPNPFTDTSLNKFVVSGIALYEDHTRKRLDVFCVAKGNLYSFHRSENPGDANAPPSFVPGPPTPLTTSSVSGTPCVATTLRTKSGTVQICSLIVPSLSGGLLHTSTKTEGESYRSGQPKTEWGPVDHVATNLGIISAVTATAVPTGTMSGSYGFIVLQLAQIVGVCIAQGRLYSVEGPFMEPLFEHFSRYKYELGNDIESLGRWKVEVTNKIAHPGEVTGNPVLLQRESQHGQLELLVPSAAGGVFHFVRTPSTPGEWHMIGGIEFPDGYPAAGSLAFFQPRQSSPYIRAKLTVALQIGGQLYITRLRDEREPWSRCSLHRVDGPGPSND